ncbi:hypothetical protein NE237_023742 [Protea cynaroides]|uniref:Uncharacterized protein n=1 Tax=Protea cynaroides TaxID=273540 RepID=A0A9Q0HFJ8_9MAGN|nr:hypothetical protein NE237_023742 [Protea cynaroides]
MRFCWRNRMEAVKNLQMNNSKKKAFFTRFRCWHSPLKPGEENSNPPHSPLQHPSMSHAFILSILLLSVSIKLTFGASASTTITSIATAIEKQAKLGFSLLRCCHLEGG